MTKEKVSQLSDLFLKLLISALIALCTFALNAVVGGIGELKTEIQSMRREIQSLSIDLATVQTRLNYHEQTEKARQ